jgi:uncharacterized protein (DUF302 family)
MTSNNILITHTTPRSVKEVMDLIEKNLREKGVKVFARISHSEAAKAAGLTMQDEEVLIFGNPKVGTALMLERPSIGIELPLKILAWRAGDKTQVEYQDLDKLADMFQLKMPNTTLDILKTFMANLMTIALK